MAGWGVGSGVGARGASLGFLPRLLGSGGGAFGASSVQKSQMECSVSSGVRLKDSKSRSIWQLGQVLVDDTGFSVEHVVDFPTLGQP